MKTIRQHVRPAVPGPGPFYAFWRVYFPDDPGIAAGCPAHLHLSLGYYIKAGASFGARPTSFSGFIATRSTRRTMGKASGAGTILLAARRSYIGLQSTDRRRQIKPGNGYEQLRFCMNAAV